MIYSSLAVLAMSASAAVSPFGNLIHLHPHSAQPDSRIVLTIYNSSVGFRDLKIAGHVYTVMSHQAIQVKAPAGTTIVADSTMPDHRRGDVLLEVTPQLNQQKVTID